MPGTRYIVINGFTRGGTNIIWNVLQSHPDIGAPGYETGEILFDTPALMRLKRTIKLLIRAPIAPEWIMRQYFEKKIVAAKPDVRNDSHDTKSSRCGRQPITCLKSVDNDINLMPFFFNATENCFGIGLLRNGLALCEGWMRRGIPAKACGKMYHKYGQLMIRYEKKWPNFHLIRFEDLLEDIFGASEKLFQLLDCHPHKLKKIRLKSKMVFQEDGSYQPAANHVNEKNWYSENEINRLLNKNINHIQIRKLDPSARREFLHEAADTMEKLGY